MASRCCAAVTVVLAAVLCWIAATGYHRAVVLHGDTAPGVVPALPWTAHAINAVGDLLQAIGVPPPQLEAKALLQHAVDTTGLHDFGTDMFPDQVKDIGYVVWVVTSCALHVCVCMCWSSLKHPCRPSVKQWRRRRRREARRTACPFWEESHCTALLSDLSSIDCRCQDVGQYSTATPTVARRCSLPCSTTTPDCAPLEAAP